jgi:dihydroxyacetone kinase-like protein
MKCAEAADVRRILDAVGARIIENRELLTDLDRAIGDADHGVNMARGFEAVIRKLASMPDADIEEILKATGMTLVSTVGGASGPLYGTAFLYAAQELKGVTEVTRAHLARAVRAAVNGIVRRGRAVIGDKTMLDAIEPVAAFLESSDASACDGAACAEEVRKRVRSGMESTIPMQARKGRASFLGERSVGHCDPGAMSGCIIIEAALGALCDRGAEPHS